MFAAAVVPDGLGMRAVQEKGHMRAGFDDRSTISAIDAVAPIPATCICSSFLAPDRGSRVHAALPVNATEYVQIRMAIRRQVEAE
jgi:hypothetical protein